MKKIVEGEEPYRREGGRASKHSERRGEVENRWRRRQRKKEEGERVSQSRGYREGTGRRQREGTEGGGWNSVSKCRGQGGGGRR